MRLWWAPIVGFVVVGCASPSPDLRPADTSSFPSTTVESSTSVTTNTTTLTTITAPGTTSGATTTVTSETELPQSWVGVEFTTVTTHPHVEGVEILANIEHFPVDFVVDDEHAGVYGWYVGGVVNAWEGPSFSVVVVGEEPNPYVPTEWEQFDRGVEPEVPDPSVEHTLTIWAIRATGPASYRIVDEMEIRLPATLLGYNALMTVTQEPWVCEVDPPLQPFLESDPAGIDRTGVLFAFFDDDGDYEIEERYPAILAFTVDDGTLEHVSPESVRCILRFDPEDY